MKKLLLVMLAVLFFSGCSEVKDAVIDNQKVWGEYVYFANVIHNNSNGTSGQSDVIALDDLDFNFIGIDRDIASNLSVDQYDNSELDFNDGFYPYVKDGKDIEPGSLDGKVEYISGYRAFVDLSSVISTPGNEELKIGDEIFQIEVYSDPNHKFLIETFYFVL